MLSQRGSCYFISQHHDVLCVIPSKKKHPTRSRRDHWNSGSPVVACSHLLSMNVLFQLPTSYQVAVIPQHLVDIQDTMSPVISLILGEEHPGPCSEGPAGNLPCPDQESNPSLTHLLYIHSNLPGWTPFCL